MQYLVSVIDDTAGLATPNEMAAIDVFNGRLRRPATGRSRCGRSCEPVPMSMVDLREAITQTHHEEWARVVAILTRRFGDLDTSQATFAYRGSK
jgi:hypothetical protein